MYRDTIYGTEGHLHVGFEHGDSPNDEIASTVQVIVGRDITEAGVRRLLERAIENLPQMMRHLEARGSREPDVLRRDFPFEDPQDC
jgi:hypothetical protein